MTDVRTAERVHRDLACGNPRGALRRLRTALAKDPDNVETLQMLAQIHRDLGDAAEAGRWGYLTEEVTDQEILAFERAHPQPAIRLQLLGWTGDPDRLTSLAARDRLAQLRASAAAVAAGQPLIPGQRHPEDLPTEVPDTAAIARIPTANPFRTYVMLMVLIAGGSVGSIIAVAGIRAVFGVRNWFAPVNALISALARLITS